MSYFDDHEDQIIYGASFALGSVECKRCGKAGLHWENDDGCWVLLTSHDEIHKCDEARVRRAMASEFEPIK